MSTPNYFERLEILESEAAQGAADAQFRLGAEYEKGGIFVGGDLESAFIWYSKAAKQNHFEAHLKVAEAYGVGRGISKDIKKAEKYYRWAAELANNDSSGNSFLRVAKAHDHGKGIPKNPEEAAKWYRKSAECGNVDALYRLGCAFESGHGVPRDDAEAVRLFQLAAEQGHSDAQVALGNAYDDGISVQKDHEEAVKWYRRADKLGNGLAKMNLGYAYHHGQGVLQDYRQAEDLYLVYLHYFDEARTGFIESELGDLYRDDGNPCRNDTMALHYYQDAADLGFEIAQNALGDMYRYGGEDLEVDYELSVYWYQQASERGHPQAQYSLAEMYANGQGVAQDYQLAFMYCVLAATKAIEHAAKSRDILAAKMTPEQIHKAEKMTREWNGTHG